MLIFLDTATIEDIKPFVGFGLVDGITTNPSLVATQGGKFETLIQEMAALVKGPISAEVIASDYEGMVTEGLHLSTLSPYVVVKLPLTLEGLKACHTLRQKGIPVNMTLCFSANQALLAAKAEATYVSPFIGRLDDQGQDGIYLIEEICTLFQHYPDLTTKVLVASVRNPQHITQSALLGADVITLPPALLRQMVSHPLTDSGLAKFLKDWAKGGETIGAR